MVLLNFKNFKISSGKSQVETLGLVIIIAIIAFVFVIVLALSSRQEPSLNQDYLKLNADNLRSTILKTNICPGISIKDEIINCNLGFFNCENLNSCQDLNNIIQDIIEDSLTLRNNYEFQAGNILVKKGNCNEVQASSIQPIPNIDIEVSLKLC